MNEFKVRKGLIVQGSGSTILDIQGSQGQLFSVTDSLSGSLFSVNDISGIPIMEVFSDDKVNLGTFGAEAIKVSGSFATMTGSLFGTASWANNSISASFSTNANNVNISTQDTTLTTYNVTFTGGASGMNTLNVDTTALRYTPSNSTFETPIVNSTTAVRGGNGSAVNPAFSFSGDTNTGIFNAAADTLGFSTSGNERMRIDPNGNVGIGSTSPTSLLQVGPSDAVDSLFVGEVPNFNMSGGYFGISAPTPGSGFGHLYYVSISTSDGGSYGTTSFSCNAEEGFNATSHGIGSNLGQGTLNVTRYSVGFTANNKTNIDLLGYNNSNITIGTFSPTGGYINLLTQGTSSLYIDTSQRVGIGTTSPSEKLEVSGNIKATGFKTPSGTANQVLTADGDVYDLDYKVDISTTPSSVYATDASGNQVMKPISEFQTPVGDYVTLNTSQTVTGNKTFNDVGLIKKNITFLSPNQSGGYFSIGGTGGYDFFDFYSLDGTDGNSIGKSQIYSNGEDGNQISHFSLDNQVGSVIQLVQNDTNIRDTYYGQRSAIYINSQNNKVRIEGTINKYANLGTSLITGTKNFEFPNNSGTLALLSDLSGFTTPSEVATQITTAINSNKTSFTYNILVSNWTLVSGKYEAVISNAGILANSFVDVIPSNDHVDIVRNAQIYPSVLISAGNVKVYSKFLPSDTITVTININ